MSEGLNAGYWIVLREVVRYGIPHDLTAGLQYALSDVQRAAPLDLQHGIAKIRGLEILERQRPNRREDIGFEAFQNVMGVALVTVCLPVLMPFARH